MIAQLSHSEPRGSPDSSSNGVRCAGSLARNSGVVVCPQTFVSSNSSPAARTKIRAVRLLSDGGRMLSEFVAMTPPMERYACFGERSSDSDGRVRSDERLDRVGDVDAVDAAVAALDADQVRLA